MRKSILPLAAVLLVLGACSPAAQNETAQAAETVAGDVNATAAQRESATDAALGAAEARSDNVADAIGNKADRIADSAGAAAKDIGNEIQD